MKRLVFCFDGSWNQLDAPYPTNVVFTAESVLPIAADGTAQVIFYDEGVGTEKGEKLTGGMFGKGLEKNLNDAYRFLIFNHTPGDEIYVFGFSRGAFTARSFVGLISNSGILNRRYADRANEALANYRQREDSEPFRERMNLFRSSYGPDICVSAAEDRWRAANVANYTSRPLLHIRYVGVWDTVGSLGIPSYLFGADFANSEYRFHDLSLSPFVKSARHAVSIDERKKDFTPTLWDNLDALNQAEGFAIDAGDAPYQQKWFPGGHGSVGGGGDVTGLSDQALDWVWDGARQAGLKLDSSPGSRVYGLVPDAAAPLENMTKKPNFSLIGIVIDRLPTADRTPGPKALHEVSVSARRRWFTPAGNLPEGRRYRPKTLGNVASALDTLDPSDFVAPPGDDFKVHEVAPGETLRGIALAYFHDAEAADAIFRANRYKIDDPNRIYVGQTLRIPGKL